MNLDYQLSPQALIDLNEIVRNRAEHSSEDSAYELSENIISAFENLARTPGIGHRRSDLTQMPYYFYLMKPYLIVYARGIDPLPIIAILHASRNVKKLLKKRTA